MAGSLLTSIGQALGLQIWILVLARCNQQGEFIIHMLRDCPTSKLMWEGFVPLSKMYSFFSLRTNQWVKENVDDVLRIGVAINCEWQQLFLSIIWHIWKARNEVVFEGKKICTTKIRNMAAIFSTDMQILLHNFGQ